MYTESMDVLEHHIKPLRTVPGVILEQAYLNKMQEGIKPLALLAAPRGIHVASSQYQYHLFPLAISLNCYQKKVYEK